MHFAGPNEHHEYMNTNCPSHSSKITALTFVSALLLSGACLIRATEPAKPAAPESPKPAPVLFSGVVSEAVHLTATVEQIDLGSRQVTLKGEQGGIQTIRAGHEVQRLSEIHRGDTIEINYSQSVTVLANEGAGAPEGHDIVEVERAPQFQKPSASRVTTTRVRAIITAVDKKARTVTLKGPQRTETINVDPRVAKLDQVKVGDSVQVEYIESVAAAVTKRAQSN